MSGVTRMSNYVLVMTEEDTNIVTGAHHIEATTDIAAINKIPEDQLREDDWTLFQTIAASSKKEMITDGRIDEVLEEE